jgi:hypothetical protein
MVKVLYRAQEEKIEEEFTEMQVRDLGRPEEAAREFTSGTNLPGDALITAKELGCWPRILFRKTVDELQ